MENEIKESFDEQAMSFMEKLEEAKNKGNKEALSNSLLLALDFFLNHSEYKTLLSLIDEFYDDSFKKETKIEILTYKSTAFIRLEDYNGALDVLKEKENLGLEDRNDIANTRFYESIAYEALDEIELAIDALERLEDNIKRRMLINKYLKLALLYNQVGRLDKARDAYRYASQVDNNRMNDMFPLVESDLYYSSGKYFEALDSFQTFFMRSSNKYKYLDRYIDIEIKLNNLGDAYNFYKKFKDKDGIRLSKQNRYRFYKSASKLLELLGKNDELLELKAEMENTKPVYHLKAEREKDELIGSIVSYQSRPLSKYDSNKNVVFHFFKLLENVKEGKLFYIEKVESNFVISEYLKTRMRDVKIALEDAKEKGLIDYLTLREDKELFEFPDYSLNLIKSHYLAISLNDEYNDFGFIVIEGVLDKGVLNVFKNALFSTLVRLDAIKKSSESKDLLYKSLDSMEIGFIEYMGDMIVLHNDVAKKLLKTKSETVTFDYFNQASESENMFSSSFKDGKSRVERFKFDDSSILLEFTPVLVDGIVYAYVKDVSDTYPKEAEKSEFLNRSSLSFYNSNFLKKRVEELNESYLLIGLDIEIIENGDSMDKRNTKLDGLYRYLSQASPKNELFYLGENHFLILSLNTDRRVIESTFKRIVDGEKQLYKYTQSLREKTITGFASKSLKGKSFDEIKDVIEYGFRHSKERGKFLILDNEEKREYALYKTYETEIINRLKTEKLSPEYIPVLDSENRIHYFFSKFNLPYEIPYVSFEEILTKNNLESKSDQVMVEKVFTEMMIYSPITKFIIPIHPETIYNDNFIKRVSILFKKSKIENRVIFEVENIQTEKYFKALKSLKNAGIKLSTTFTSLSDLKDSSIFNIIFINLSGEDNLVKSLSLSLSNTLGCETVCFSDEPQENTLRLSYKTKKYTKKDIVALDN